MTFLSVHVFTDWCWIYDTDRQHAHYLLATHPITETNSRLSLYFMSHYSFAAVANSKLISAWHWHHLFPVAEILNTCYYLTLEYKEVAYLAFLVLSLQAAIYFNAFFKHSEL